MDIKKSRREILQMSGLGILGLAGCMEGSNEAKCPDGAIEKENEEQILNQLKSQNIKASIIGTVIDEKTITKGH